VDLLCYGGVVALNTELRLNTSQRIITVAVPMALVGAGLSTASLVFRRSPDLGVFAATGLTVLFAFSTTFVGILRFKATGKEPTPPVILVAIIGAELMSVLLGASVAGFLVVYLISHPT
jgi:hypothetical protein